MKLMTDFMTNTHDLSRRGERMREKLEEKAVAFGRMIQLMADRLYVGEVRYGHLRGARSYMQRLELEVGKYRETGNLEHLLNAANYCFLEFEHPSAAEAYLDETAESVTRATFGEDYGK